MDKVNNIIVDLYIAELVEKSANFQQIAEL
jgi:hypothetical protein